MLRWLREGLGMLKPAGTPSGRGALTVSSQEKQGATFTLSIPYVPSTKPTIV